MAVEKIYEICFYGGLILAILLLIAAVILFIVLKIPRVFGELTGRSAKKGIQDIRNGGTTESNISKREQAKYYNQGSGKIKAREAVSDKPAKDKKKADGANVNAVTQGKNAADTETTEVLGAGRYADTDTTEVLGAGRYADTDTTEVLGAGRYADDDEATAVLAANDENDGATAVLAANDENDGATAVLAANDENDGATAVLAANDENDGATAVLTGYEDNTDEETTVLSREDEAETTVLTGGQTGAASGRIRVIYNVVVTHTNEGL